jgi:hypothetical protein
MISAGSVLDQIADLVLRHRAEIGAEQYLEAGDGPLSVSRLLTALNHLPISLVSFQPVMSKLASDRSVRISPGLARKLVEASCAQGTGNSARRRPRLEVGHKCRISRVASTRATSR